MSYPRYAKYKDSGVAWLGEVPAHWEVRRLKHVCQAFPSNVDKKSYENQDSILLCNYTDVYYNDEITSNISFMEATASDEEVAKFKLEPGDIIITKDSETPDDIAVSAYVPSVLPGVVCGYHLTIVRPSSIMSGRYVKRLFDSAFSRAQFAVAANGLTRFGLSQYAIDNALFPIPPFAEQSAIAAFLDCETGRIDALVAEQEKLMALLAEKRQAVISHAVTKGLDPDAPMKESGIEWLGKVPKHWEVTALKRLILKGSSISYGIVQPGEPQDEGIPFVQTTNMTNGNFSVEELQKTTFEIASNYPRSRLTGGEVILGIRASIGAAHIVPSQLRGCNLSRGVARIACDTSIFNGFLVAYLMSGQIENYWQLGKQGSTFNEVSIETVKELSVVVPPVDEQMSIANFVTEEAARLDALTAEARRAIDLLKERRAALISAAVTGRIDVRGLVGEKAA